MTTSHRSFHRPLPSWSALSSSRRSFTGNTPLPIAAGDTEENPISPSTRTAKLDPTREIIWSNEATKTLIETWGDKYKELNRGSLKQSHWQEVTDVVNLRHDGELLCTEAQVKNRIDTVKKKYKKEKIRVLESAGNYVPRWPFFDFLDFLIGSPEPEPEEGKPTCRRGRKMSFPVSCGNPVGRRSKRTAPEMEVGRRKFDAIAEVAAKIVAEEEGGEGEIGKVAEAIEKFGERYERVEREKMDRMIELETHKMKLAIDLNVQIMNYVSELRMKVDRNEQVGTVDDEKASHWSGFFFVGCYIIDIASLLAPPLDLLLGCQRERVSCRCCDGGAWRIRRFLLGNYTLDGSFDLHIHIGIFCLFGKENAIGICLKRIRDSTLMLSIAND